MIRDTNRPIFSTVEKWGRRRRCRRPFSLPATPPGLFQCRHARTCSTAVRFNFGTGSVPTRRDRLHPPSCHPGLDPGSRAIGTALARLPWTPDQVRGDSKGRGGLVHGRGGWLEILTGQQWNKSGHDGRTEETSRAARPSSGPDKPREKRRGFRARPCGGHDHACDRHRYRPGRHPERAADRAPGVCRLPGAACERVRHLPTDICRRQCRQAGRVGKGRHSRPAFEGPECRVGSDLPTRCLCRRRAGIALAGATASFQPRARARALKIRAPAPARRPARPGCPPPWPGSSTGSSLARHTPDAA